MMITPTTQTTTETITQPVADPLLLEFPTLRTGRLGLGKVYDYVADLSIPWVRDLFSKIEEGVENSSLDNGGVLSIHLKVKKSNNTQLNYPIVILGEIEISYKTHCIRCLMEMGESLTVPVKAYFLSSAFKDMDEYQDQDVAYAEENELDLYFVDGKDIDLEQAIREAIFLNLNDFPIHDEECKGLCFECGDNLNEGSCSHSAQVSEIIWQ